VAQRVSRGIALLFHDRGTRRWVGGQQHALAALYPRERPGTQITGGWGGPRAGLDGCGKSRPHRDSITGTSSPVAQSLYRLSYRAHRKTKVLTKIRNFSCHEYPFISVLYAQGKEHGVKTDVASRSIICYTLFRGRQTTVAQWLRCCATNRKVAGSISAGVSGYFSL
jgi:hypothetical protein